MSSAAMSGGNGQAPTTATTSATGGNGQAPATTSQTDSTSNGQAPTTAAPQTNEWTPPSFEDWKRAQQERDEARREAAKYRNDAKAREDAALTAEQKRERDFSELQAKTFEYEARLQQQALKIAGYEHGASLGISDIKAALALVQAEHGHELKYGDDGTPENIADLLKAVLKEHPILAAQQQPRTPAPTSGGATNPGRSAGNGGLTLEMIKAMPMRERIARMSEITAWEKANTGKQ